MIDPRREVISLWDRKTGTFQDKTSDVERHEPGASGKILVTFAGSRAYSYNWSSVRILRNPSRVPLPEGSRVEIRGQLHTNVIEVLEFVDQNEAHYRVFFQRSSGPEYHRLYETSDLRVLNGPREDTGAASVLRYWRAILGQLPEDDPLQYPFKRLTFVHPESVLATYLAGAPINTREPTGSPIFPFNCNLSQRRAVELALSRSISVIEGPPGTGKTETILNLVASIIAGDGGTIGVVASTNSAVDNVRDKLAELGLGHVVASLGKTENRQKFFLAQAGRGHQVVEFINRASSTPPDPDQMAECDRKLRGAQQAERRRAELSQEVEAYRLERAHFLRHLGKDPIPGVDDLPLLRKSSDRILDYLAESEAEHRGYSPGLIRRIRRYFRYGSLRGLDPEDTEVVLAVQRGYYDRRIAEIEREIQSVRRELELADFGRLLHDYRLLSIQAFEATLSERYRSMKSQTYTKDNFRHRAIFEQFVREYPVILSTCHSLRDCLADGYLLDYLIIDEASQVDLLTAGLALASCRNVVVVGDLKQLPPISAEAAARITPPTPAFDYRRHSVISSLIELYEDELPRTLLREHYRCDPAIIGFCNKAFYGGELVPFTVSAEGQPMVVVRTTEGNHMRQHLKGGRSNQREIDVINNEVIPRYCAGVPASQIGITTPYRLQADKVVTSLIQDVESDTIHKFQGRQKDVVILTTVLDETWRGRTGMAFTDDPHKINVAVSRAIKRFILVTNHAMLPTSQTIRALVGYIRYLNPGDLVDSQVVSIFDLLYRDYNERLRPLALRLRAEMAYQSEDIAWTLLLEILSEPEYADMSMRSQVLLRSLLSDLHRLSAEQRSYVQHRASVDFVAYNRITNEPVLAIEVDGFAFHENNPTQLAREQLKNEILEAAGLPLLRLATTESGEEVRIRLALNRAREYWARDPAGPAPTAPRL